MRRDRSSVIHGIACGRVSNLGNLHGKPFLVDRTPSKTRPQIRTESDRYMSLVQKKKDLFESETQAREQQLCANEEIKSSLTIHRRTIVTREATKQKQMFNLENTSCEEINGSHRTMFGASQVRNAMFPGCRVYTSRQINKINIEAVFKETNTQIQNALLSGSNTIKSEQLVANAQCTLSNLVNKNSSIPVIDLISSDDSEEYVLVSSGETLERKEFCKACHKLYNKMADVKSSTIQNVIDPNNWPCSFWIMKYPSSSKKSGQRCSRYCVGGARSMENILKQLKLKSKVSCSTKSTANRGKCSRPHIFLQRNLQICKKTRKALSVMKTKKQRKLKQSHECQTKANRDEKKSKTKHENLYVFKVASTFAQSSEESSNEESETLMGLVKRKRLSKPGTTRKKLFSTKSSGKSKATAEVAPSKNEHSRGSPDLTIEKSSKIKHNNSVMSEVASSSASPFSMTVEELDDADSFAWVQRGSFRDMLDMLNSGHSLSAIVRE